ncbi:hypothetical protein B9Z55_005386 [Caenorhabditis nigoni]|uniref:Uncharacterized protein n=1 Tax=Caenorhabditis nigoni TaxID=1611254 RepID=A0A2G5V0Q1_9PELO|nr:hypothetical protein B9Z55_005386 [Caenorhabditis nigoni]
MLSLFCLYFNIHPISVLSFLLSAQAFVIYTFLPPDQSDVHLAVLLVVLMPIFSIKRFVFYQTKLLNVSCSNEVTEFSSLCVTRKDKTDEAAPQISHLLPIQYHLISSPRPIF